jgi:ergothioneine biosynthesis protein EgtB
MRSTSQQASVQDSVLEMFRKVRERTEELCRPLEIEDYIPQPSVDVSPPKWNIAHTTWFFEEMILKSYVPGYQMYDPAFGFLFNSYYNSIGDRTERDRRGDLSRPTVRQVFDYRKHVDALMMQLLSSSSVSAELEELVVLGVNHEQQHQELFLTDLKFTLSQNPLRPVYDSGFGVPASDSLRIEAKAITIPSGIYDIGFHGDGFSFDNEHCRHKVFLHEFTILDRPVTNAEYLEFIRDGGYRDHRLWHSEGWDWVSRESIGAPLYWEFGDADAGPNHFTLNGIKPVDPNEPVCHISWYEASAFAEWKGMRLPTEFEWEASESLFTWGRRWEWTNSAYLPYPGFKKPKGAVGEYNGKFMANQMVLRGASDVTPIAHSRPSYRNFFHPHLRWQYTGIRLALRQNL